ncbi:MAG: cytochrome P450 [Burkholderiales bacterium]|nr:cytochrome P450 [Burkholderiales bacterium]
MNGDTPLEALDVSSPLLFQQELHGPLFARLRREAPVHHCRASAYGPYWSITRHADIQAVELDHVRFSSQGNIIIGDVPAAFDSTQAFATSDPPVHTHERGAVTPALSAQRIARLEAHTREGVRAVLDALPRGLIFDWAERVSAELTARMVGALFDLAPQERARLAAWAEVLVTAPAPGAIAQTWAQRAAILEEYRERMLALWRARAPAPGEDVISALTRSSYTAGMVLDPDRLIGTITLVAGANEAARGALSGCIVAFDRFPGEWQRLRAQPALADNAAAEIVRWQTPIIHMRRTATADVELHGQRIRRGDRVVLWYCSANRDEALFDAADTLRIDRANARRHLSFGAGIHRCIGAHAAHVQVRVLLQEMLARDLRVELDGVPRRLASNFSAGYAQLPACIRC